MAGSRAHAVRAQEPRPPITAIDPLSNGCGARRWAGQGAAVGSRATRPSGPTGLSATPTAFRPAPVSGLLSIGGVGPKGVLPSAEA